MRPLNLLLGQQEEGILAATTVGKKSTSGQKDILHLGQSLTFVQNRDTLCLKF